MEILGLYNYWVVVFLMMLGFYVLISRANLVKKVVGLNIFQTSVIIFYVSTGKIIGGTAPIIVEDAHGAEAGVEEAPGLAQGLSEAGETAAGIAAGLPGETIYSNPLPHVLMLTAIVVGVATMAMALALVVRIKEAYGTIEDDEIQAQVLVDERRESAPA